jgi:hypothetical protein
MEGEMVARFMGGIVAAEEEEKEGGVVGGVMAVVKFGVTMMTRESDLAWRELGSSKHRPRPCTQCYLFNYFVLQTAPFDPDINIGR